MTIFWQIEYSRDLNETKNTGYQILDDNLNTIKITDEAGNKLEGKFDYSVIGDTTAPAWWVE